MALILTILAVGVLLIVNELWWRTHRKPNEISRKFVHITVGSFVAVWPFFLSWHQILFLSAAFLVVVLISKYFKVFSAIHSVQRPTWGELYFALAVGVIALITNHQGIYAVALLQMSLADGLAAVIGLRFGKGNRYYVFGNVKSVIGTATFFVVSLALLLAYSHYSQASLSIPYAVGLAIVTSLIENMGVYGLDNLLVPVVIAALLTI